jgi:D-amino peptidase
MKIFLAVDMEGTTGLERLEEIFRGLPGFDLFRQVMAGDANAVIQGAIEGGATEIVVSDSHGYMCNIHPDDILPGVQLRRGLVQRSWCQAKGLDTDFDAVIMIGFHAKSGTANGILSHTWITGFRDVRVNGDSVPEPSLNGLLAGDMGVPVIMLSGDDIVALEASPILGDIEYVQTKKSVGFFKGDHLPIDKSRKVLREAAKKAVKAAKSRKPAILKGPVTIEVDVSADAIDDAALGQRAHDNISYIDGGYDGPNVLSDFEHIMRNNPDLTSPKDGTVAIETSNFGDAYKKLHKVLGDIYERDLENLIDIVADVDGYDRPDLDNILGSDYPLNEIGPRR